jgi:2,4-dienoyl-CoA reductase-like NADH-dependent reductase (Old Yellow Enzyme family)/thioredoxin reductase
LAQYEHLFTPLTIGTMTVPNRILMCAHVHRLPDERFKEYYKTRAKGGAGLLIQSHPLLSLTLGNHLPMLNSKAILSFSEFVKEIHSYGTKIVAQFLHPGNLGGGERMMGGASLAPSAISRKGIFPKEVPHEMNIDEIKATVKNYADVAAGAREAGYDGVEIASIWGLLVASFISPLYNQRSDDYGGSVENRLRFPLELIAAVRAAVGSDFVVGFKLDGDEYIDGGITLDDAKDIASRLEAGGGLDYINVGAGATLALHVPPMFFPLAPFVYTAAGIKEVVNLPVFAGGRINDPAVAERILKDNQADMTAMTRPLIADPELPNKAKAGQDNLIRKCIACNDACWLPLFQGMTPLTCVINPEAGREATFAILPATVEKNVMIVGGGAAGLETARVATLRGHKVSLYEKADELGGQLNIAAKAPGRVDYAELVRYYTHQMKVLDVEVHLGTKVTKEIVKETNCDAVVIATGSLPTISSSIDIEGSNVVSTRDVLQETVEVGNNVLIVDYQYHMQALSVADFLADRGARVEILTPAIFAGSHLDEGTLEIIYYRLLDKGVVITVLTDVRAIKRNTVTAFNILTNAERQIEGIDTVVVATNGQADDALYRSLKGEVKELHIAGQCLSPRTLRDSIWDGARVGRAL